MADGIVITFKGLLAQNQQTEFQIGYIDPATQYLSNITHDPSLNIIILEGIANYYIDINGGQIIPLSNGNVIARVNYGSVSSVISFWVIPPILFPKRGDMTTMLYKFLPPNCYTAQSDTTVYSKNLASGEVLADIYFNESLNNVQNLLNNLYPPFSNSFSWEQELNDNYPWADSYDYNLVIQTVNNLSFYSDSEYDCEFLVSKYIYARFGRAVYVYIKEYNSLLNVTWVIGVARLGSATILADAPTSTKQAKVYIQDDISFYTPSIITELLKYCRKIFPADTLPTIEIIADFGVAFNMIIDIGDTYNYDPRLFADFALKYDDNAVYDTVSIITPYNPLFISSMALTPLTKTVAPLDPIFTVTATLTYVYNFTPYTTDVSQFSIYSSDYPDRIKMNGSTAMPGGSEGAVTVTAVYQNPLGVQFNISAQAFYNVNSDFWVIGSSEIGITTQLA